LAQHRLAAKGSPSALGVRRNCSVLALQHPILRQGRAQQIKKRLIVNILVVDIGGTTIKICSSLGPEIRTAPSGPTMTPAAMARSVVTLAAPWRYDVVSIGYPGEVRDGRPSREPNNLAPGWVGFDYRAAFNRPVKVLNDAAMQAIGSFESGRMLFLGLGTGLGSALVVHGTVHGLQLSQLPYKEGGTFGDFLAQRGLARLGLAAWRREVEHVVCLLRGVMVTDYVVLGGGNVCHLERLPPFSRAGHNANAFEGGFRLWRDPELRA
jgi:polyphosphate glucokinase